MTKHLTCDPNKPPTSIIQRENIACSATTTGALLGISPMRCASFLPRVDSTPPVHGALEGFARHYRLPSRPVSLPRLRSPQRNPTPSGLPSNEETACLGRFSGGLPVRSHRASPSNRQAPSLPTPAGFARRPGLVTRCAAPRTRPFLAAHDERPV